MATWNWTQALVWIITRNAEMVEAHKNDSALELAIDDSFEGEVAILEWRDGKLVDSGKPSKNWEYQVDPFATGTVTCP